MSITSGFIVLIDRGDHLNYLLQINSIFSLRNDPRIHDPDKAFTQFAEYYKDLVHSIQTLDELDAFARRVDQEYLSKFYAANNIADTDYEIKTKVRALYVSLFIQKSIQLKERAVGSGEFFLLKKTEMLDMLKNQPPMDTVPPTGYPLNVSDPMDQISFTRFYTVLKEAQRWQTHAKWEKFAFYVASMAVGEGVWYCPGGAAKPETLRRKQLFALMERVANRYHKCAKKRKASEGGGSAGLPSNNQNHPNFQAHSPGRSGNVKLESDTAGDAMGAQSVLNCGLFNTMALGRPSSSSFSLLPSANGPLKLSMLSMSEITSLSPQPPSSSSSTASCRSVKNSSSKDNGELGSLGLSGLDKLAMLADVALLGSMDSAGHSEPLSFSKRMRSPGRPSSVNSNGIGSSSADMDALTLCESQQQLVNV